MAESDAKKILVSPHHALVQAKHGWMLVNLNDFYLGRAIFEYGEYSEAEAVFLGQLFVRPGAIVEVGANNGTHTVDLAKQAAAQQRAMVAFEPQPIVFQNLCANLALNNLTNVRAWPYACGEAAGDVYFTPVNYDAAGNFGGVSMHTQSQTTAATADVRVPCVRLDDMFEGQTVGLIKIDVEGFELNVLKGATRVLAASRPILYVENDRVAQSQALIEWLWGQNYRLWWHIPPLFNPQNFFGNAHNIYNNMASFNMLAVPRELTELVIKDLLEITDAAWHPLQNRTSV